ncbi:uncharacterized protein LOC130895133 [Diorhabda carinulata]|uniref:uncharacterized protein LOC130895133 n=1 Tax=Diorhabda carinulata TaxID=1163345 RepID=UPI0025A2777D|nr:uncharacterized protein LOC130895133 [Diorhabda carinulata]
MNKNDKLKVKYFVQSEKHSNDTSYGLCTLMEHQSLVDITICCGNHVLHAHKVVLAAGSPLFRTELELNPFIEQVMISGCEFTVIRSLIEFIYCGETFVNEELFKYFVAAAKLFQMPLFENLSMNYQFSDNFIVLPKPEFISKKPKYSTYPFNTNSPPNNSTLKPGTFNILKPQKVKSKRIEVEQQACLKEALASRLAIANLKKEIGAAPQPPTFIIEDSCTETTVENFIPTADTQEYIELNMNGQIVLPENRNFAVEPATKSNVIQLMLQNGEQNWTSDKIKTIIENQDNSNVEVMFRTNDGTFVTVTDEMLQNFQKDGLQYQVIDEDGKIGEMQELRLLNKDQSERTDKIEIDSLCNMDVLSSSKGILFQRNNDLECLQTVHAALMKPEIGIPSEIKPKIPQKPFDGTSFIQQPTKTKNEPEKLSHTKFSPDIFFAESVEDAGVNDKNPVS